METEFLTLYEVAEILGVKPLTIYRMIYRGEIRATKMGRDWRFGKGEPERYLKEQESNSLFSIGMKYKSLKCLDKAIDCFKEATRIYPQNKKAHLELGKIYFENGRDDILFYKWAKERFEKVLELDSETVEVFPYLQQINSALPQKPPLEDVFEEKIKQLASFANGMDKESQGFSENTRSLAKALSEIANERDAYSKGHSEKKALYSTAVGQRLGFSSLQLELLQLATFLYDIGKVKINKEILLKPGKLNEEELEIVKQHPRLGAEILEKTGFTEEIFTSALFHHESIDGKGYPHGLSGEEIPLAARIIRVIDTFSALISERPYRKPLSFDEAINELKKGAGSEFDTNVVNTFLKILLEDKDWIFKNGHPGKKLKVPIYKILVVDNDIWTAKAIKGSLELEGFVTITARSGEEALQKVYETSPDLIITETSLSDITGGELGKRLSADHIPIIILTSSDVVEETPCLGSGADISIAKPFEIQELLVRIKALIRRIEKNRSGNQLTGFQSALKMGSEK